MATSPTTTVNRHYSPEEKDRILDEYEKYLRDTVEKKGEYGNIMKYSLIIGISYSNLYRWWNKRIDVRGKDYMAEYLAPSANRDSSKSGGHSSPGRPSRGRASPGRASRGRPSPGRPSRGRPSTSAGERANSTARSSSRGRPSSKRAADQSTELAQDGASPKIAPRGRGRPSLKTQEDQQDQQRGLVTIVFQYIRNIFAWFFFRR